MILVLVSRFRLILPCLRGLYFFLFLDGDERPSFAPKGNKAKNSQLAVGYKEDLSFVVQGDMIGVFKQQREGGKKVSQYHLCLTSSLH